jgi:hypothetical protein
MKTKMNKELTPLDVLKQLKDFVYELELGNVDKLFVSGSFEIIETALKALQIIKEKRVDIDLLICATDSVKDYNDKIGYQKHFLSEEEYNSLKEVLL